MIHFQLKPSKLTIVPQEPFLHILIAEVERKLLTYLYQLNLERNFSNENTISKDSKYCVHPTDEYFFLPRFSACNFTM